MSAVAKLQAVLGLDAKAYQAGLRDATGGAKSFQKQIADVGRAIGVAFSVGAVVQLGKALMSWASDVSHAASNIGVLTSEMMVLNEIALRSGKSVQDAQNIMARLEAEVGGAALGTKELNAVFADLGITIDDLFAEGMDPVKRLQMVGKAAMESANPTQALAEIFGMRLGPSARLFIASVVEGMPKVSEEVGDAADAMERTASAMDSLKQRANRFMVGLVDDAVEGARAVRDAWNWVTGGGENFVVLAAKRQQDIAQKRAERDAARKKAADDMRAAIEAKRKQRASDAINAAANAYLDAMGPDDPAKPAAPAARQRAARAAEREEVSRARGNAIDSDSMSRVGGFLGGERAGYDVASKQLRLLEDINRKLEEANRLAVEESDAARNHGEGGIV